MDMPQFKCDFSVNGSRGQIVVSAWTNIEARKIVEAQYPNCKFIWFGCTRI